jgi:uncharacterized protein YqjF (DUF2071 family)
LSFRPEGGLRQPQDGTRDAWLLERYHLFITGRRQQLQAAEVFHPRWHFCEAEATIFENTIGSAFALDLSRRPDAIHFSPGVQTRFGAFAG